MDSDLMDDAEDFQKCQIGGEYLLAVGSPDRDLKVRVWVRDLREVWGSLQARVKPVAGSGLTWVLSGRLQPVPSKGQSCGLPLGHRCEACPPVETSKTHAHDSFCYEEGCRFLSGEKAR